MRVSSASIREINYSREFAKDLVCAPDDVLKKFYKLEEMVGSANRFPNSFRPHASGTADVYIGYLTRSGQHWRILFEHDNQNPMTVVFLRLVTHKSMDLILKDC